MIIILEFLSLVLYSYWMMRRAAGRGRRPGRTSAAPLSAMAIGLDDDSLHRPASDGAWTALDEHQLIRLLTDSAP